MARSPRLTMWNWILAALVALGVYAIYLRRAHGWGPVAYLRDTFPWGLCSALNVFCGLAIALGAFLVAAAVYILDIRPYRDLVRPSAVLGVLGFLVAVTTLSINRPFHGWSLFGMWSAQSVLVGALWTVLLYLLVLVLLFLPELQARFGREFPAARLRLATLIALLLATAVATVHQLSLTRLLVSTPVRFSPLWATPLLPTLFFVSAVCAALALLIFVCIRTARAYGKGLPLPVLAGMGKALAMLLFLYLLLRLLDGFERGLRAPLGAGGLPTVLLALELALLAAPTLLLARPNGNPAVLNASSALVLAGFIANRLNTSITAREVVAGVSYYPHWTEVAISYSAIALGVAGFALCAKHLPILPDLPPEESAPIPAQAA